MDKKIKNRIDKIKAMQKSIIKMQVECNEICIDLIKKSGYVQKYVAQQIGITEQNFSKKVSAKTFTLQDIELISRFLQG